MNILIVHNSYQRPGGEDIVVAQEGKLLEERGHKVTFYLRSNHELDTLTFREKLGMIGRVISAKDSKIAINRLLRDTKPDIVHVHNTFAMVSPSVYQACQEDDAPVVQTLHNYRLLCPAATLYRDGNRCQECVTNGLLRSVRHSCYHDSRVMTGTIALMLKTHRARQTWTTRVDAYIAISQFLKDKFVQSGFRANRIHVKPNFVEPDPGERQLGVGDFALFVGRLSPEKGVLTLLRAWQHLRPAIPLVIAGDGPMRSLVEEEVSAKHMRSIRIIGQTPRNEVYRLMKQAAFVVVPSVWDEPFGLIVAEAFACGTPVIGASVGAIQETVDDRVTGLQVAPNDPIALANKVEWAWNHLPEMADMGRAARRVYERRYTPNVNYQLLMEVYASAVDTHFRSKRKRAFRVAA